MKRIRFDILFLVEAIASGGIAFLFGLAREPGLSCLWLVNANLCILIAALVIKGNR